MSILTFALLAQIACVGFAILGERSRVNQQPVRDAWFFCLSIASGGLALYLAMKSA